MIDEATRVARIAASAGASELKSYQGRFSVREKAPKDLVTEADVAAQRAIYDVLITAFPKHVFIGEEDGHDKFSSGLLDDPNHEPIWIVDPLDGTVNYVHQLQSYAVSIAMYHQQRLQVGVVLDPVCHQLYWAARDRGAYLNDTPIHVSKTERIEQALLACSFSAGVRSESDELSRFAAVLGRAQAIRRLGSAALNMCYVAAGRLDGYWATSVKPWDVAAGALIVEEAGGNVMDVSGRAFDTWKPRFVATGTEPLNAQIRGCWSSPTLR